MDEEAGALAATRSGWPSGYEKRGLLLEREDSPLRAAALLGGGDEKPDASVRS